METETKTKEYVYPSLMMTIKELVPDYHVYVAMIKLGHGIGTEYQVVFIASTSVAEAVYSLNENPNLERIVNIEQLTTTLQTLNEQVKKEQKSM